MRLTVGEPLLQQLARPPGRARRRRRRRPRRRRGRPPPARRTSRRRPAAARWAGTRGGQALDEPPVDGLQPVQRRLGLGDLHLGGGEAAPLGPLGEPAGEEGLAGAVLAADGLEDASRRRRPCPGPRRSRPSNRSRPTARRSRPADGHGAAAQRVDDLAPAGRADRTVTTAPPRPNCSRSRAMSSRTVRRRRSCDSTG